MKKFSRIIALLLCVMLLLSMLPSGVFAVEYEAAVEAPVVGAVDDEPSIPIFEDTSYSFAERAADLIARMSVAQKGAQLITTPAAAIPASSLGGGALNVPLTKNIPQYYWWCESLHGYNRLDSSSKGVYAHDHPYENIGQWGPDNAVSYPQSLTVASTWNPDLYYAEGREVSDEIRELSSRNPYTGNASDLNFYSPTVNMHRDVRWGRNEESYSEDPYLTIKMGSQYVLGMEGKDQDGNLLDPDGYYQAHSTLKHYVANNSEQNRTNGGAVSSLDALRNYYMAPYRGIIKATNVSSIMTAYSTFNAEPCSYSSYLMDTVLRQIYGFEGYVTSDCDSVGTMVQHTKFVNPRTGKSLTNVERLANALAHGEDLECIGGYAGVGNYGSYAQTMIDSNIQTDKGLFTENTMDISLLRLFTARVATGEFDDDLTFTKEAQERTEAQIAALGEGADIRAIPYNQTKERLDILDQVNNEGVVMLQNTDNYLPLDLASGGEYKVVIIGAWQTNMYLGLYSAKSTNSYNHVNIQKGLTDAILAKNPDATFTYILNDTVSDANRAAIEAADLCIAVCGAAGSYSQEGRDRSSLAMASNQAAMVSQVGKWNPNTIAVLEYCGPVETYTFRDDVKAILWSCFGGIRKGIGFGNIITGVVNPSGKVTDTWLHDASYMPPMLNYDLYPSEDQPGRTYMYYEGEGVDYPFGYGLSFTSYAYSNLSIDKTSYDANETVKVSFDVTNTGDVAGKEIAEMFIAQPGAPAELNRPIRRLEGFEKVELQPGETKTVELEVSIPDLAYYDEAADCYAVDTGAYQVQVGKDSASANLTADFTVTGAMDIYPEVLTVKANAVGDTEKGIEERLIYDNGSVINPQLTVTMNNEQIYGYIIADQQSTIKNMKSCALPEGMTFTYETNRPSVVTVEGDVIKAVGPGVATVTVTGELDGHTVTTDFVVYVETKPQAATITVDGKPLEGYQGNKILYEYEVARGAEVPVVAATVASDELSVAVEQAESVPGIAKVIVTEISSGSAITYQIGIGYKPVSTDFAEGWDAAKAKGWTIVNEDAEKVAFSEDGLTLTPQFGEFGYGKEQPVKNIVVESALGDWVAQTTIKPAGNIGKTGATHRDEAGLIVYGDDGNSYRIVYNNRWNASNGVITYQNSRINVYLVNAGNDNNFSIANASVPAGTQEIHLRMIRVGNTCQAQWSSNGTTWSNIGNAEPMDAALPQVGVFARGNDFTATFDGLDILKVSDVRPQLGELKIDGNLVEGFDPAIYQYNMKLKEPTDQIPVITAAPIAEDLDVAITQFDAPTGVAKVVVSSAYASQIYSIGLNYGPSYSYLADGTLGDEWTVEGDAYKLIQGKGLGVLNTSGTALTMPGQGTWAVVAKAYIPKAGQTIGLSVRQDAQNSVNIRVQGNNLTVQPSRTNAGRDSTYGYTTTTLVPDENGGAAVYFMIDKDATSYTLYCSQDGKQFTRLGNVVVTYTNPQIVLTGTQSGEDDEIACFEYVAVPAEDGFDAAITDYKAWACQNVADYVAAALPAEAAEDIVFANVPNGCTVSVSSSDSAVIAADGTVTPADADKDVTLTITVTEGSIEASATATVKVKGTAPVGNPGLKDAFADYFRIGTCVGTREVQTEVAQEFIKKNFNSVTCENEMKPQYTLDQAASQAEGNNVEVKVQLQDSTRAILDFCDANNIPMRMHVICWHSQTPTWLFREGFTNDGAFVSEEIMDQRLESYIKNLFALVKQEYPNLTFYAVDVVNEAFTDDNPAVMRSPSLSGWIAVYGNSTKFIYKAFEYAQKYKPEGCMLCYNDYNEYNPGKLEAISAMCKDLYEKGLLDAIGMQSHLTVDNNPSMETYRNALATYAAIGCPIMITELDAQENAGGDEAQADYYGELFEILVEYASQIESVTFWGTNDNNSWRSTSHPLAFVNYEPKEAYYSILDAVSDHEHDYEVTVTPPTCTEPGYSTRVCSVCGRTRVFDRTAATGHIWDAGVVTTEATAEADGVKTFTCTVCGEIKTARIPRIGSKVPADIDFSDPADAEKYEIVNQASSAIVANEGLSLTSTTNSSPEAAGEAFKPSDLISIPVGGNFSATLKFQKSGGSAFSFFGDTDLLGFYLADDNDNFVGIRAGNRAFVNLVKKNGVVTTANAAIGASTTAGLNAAGTHWFRIDKSGDNVTVSSSTDGESFTELFVFESTGLVGEKLIIDAYNTSMWSFGGSNSYILETLNFNEIEGTEYKLGPAVVADPGSPTGYVGKFYYFDDEAEQVYFCGDLMLSYTDDPGRNAATYSPFDYKPGMMRRGGSQFKQPMKALGDGYWYYELPLTAGANQYWFNTETNTRMIPDPANHPQWSPASNWNTKNAYNAIYVPYDAKQGNDVLKAREIENPREGQNNGTWSYVPYKLSEDQASDYYMGVYLPYGYDAEREEPYKTIYVLHGGGQDESDWLGIGSVQNIIDNLYADGRIEDAPILIVPRNTRLGAGNLEATFAFVEANYNVSTDRMDRAICGLSMGGMMINSLLNDDKKRDGATFGYYGFFSGGNPSNALTSPYLLDSCYYVGSGLYEGNPYNQALVDTGAPYHFTQFAGAHDFNTWCQMFTDFAENYAFQPNAFTKKEVPFKDVNPGTYYYDAVKWAVDNGITNGFEPGIFAPDNTVTRAQIVTMLWRSAGCPAASAPAAFKDVKADQYYAEAVAWAVENGITNGVGKNKFAPNDICTRGQIVTFLWRYMGKPAAEAAAEFTDVPAGEYYADAVAWAVEAGVTTGYNDGTFKPAADCTRAQAVTFLMRALAE